MDEKQLEELEGILSHQGKTRTLVRKLKKRKPDDWKRMVFNMYLAADIIEPPKKAANVTYYQIGVYDPNIVDTWPWHCHYEKGTYLSNKYRICSVASAAEFNSASEAREHFHNWKNKKHYKMERISYEKTEFV